MHPFFRLQSLPARYLFAAGLALLGFGLHAALQPVLGFRTPFLFFIPGLVFAAALGGIGPGLLVLLASVTNGVLLLSHDNRLGALHASDRVAIGIFLLVGLLLVLLGSRLRLFSRRAADAEDKLALAQQDAGVGLFEIDLEQGSIFASPTLWTLLGRAPQFRSVPLAEWRAQFQDQDVLDLLQELQQHIDAGASDFEREVRLTLPDGRVRWLLYKTHIARNADARATRLRGVTIDISKHKTLNALLDRTQIELRQQVEDLQQLQALSNTLLELGDLGAELRAILRATVEFHGADLGLLTLRAADGAPAEVAASTGFAPALLPRLAHMPLDGGGRAIAERQRVVISDTETDPAFAADRELARELGFRAVHSTPIVNVQGDVIGVLSVQLREPRAPTEREQRLAAICANKASVYIERARTRASMHESEQRFRIALDSSAVPFNVLEPVRDAAGRITDFRWRYLNAAAARVLGFAAAELTGRSIRAMLPATWAEPGLLERYAAVVEQGKVEEFELHSSANGIEGWFHVVASPMQDAVAVWYADVSERKRQQQQLQEADRRKDEFLATLAHELRNPLAPIRQAASIAGAATATDAQKRWSHEVIERQVAHMALLLDDLLDVSRITRGMLQLRKTVTDVGAVVSAAVETARPLLDGKHQHLELVLPAEPVPLEADPLRLSQVLANLLTNAAKYTDPDGRIRLEARTEEGRLVVQVSDNGIGIRPEALEEIFQMFTQVRAAQDRSGGGLGIGLALARGLVELHGGSIRAESAGVGHGSRFTVTLPLGVAGAAPAAEDKTRAHPIVSRRILIADDNRDAADSLAELLGLQGHDVHVVYDGLAAVAAFDRWRPEVMLLDIGMPGLTGHEVAARIRSHPDGAQATLIAITGWGQERDKQRTQEAGFDAHLTKPVELRRLAQLLFPRTLVGRGGERRRSAG